MPRLTFWPEQPGPSHLYFGIGNVVVQESRFVMPAATLPVVPQNAGGLLGGNPEFLDQIVKGLLSEMGESNRVMASDPGEEPVAETPEGPEGRSGIARPEQRRGFDKIAAVGDEVPE